MTQATMEQVPTVRVMFGGDVMLGRLVKQKILQYGPDYPLGPIAGLMRQSDLTIINLECAITSSAALWPGAPKAFYFGAPPQAILSLTGAGVDIVNLANNHTLDFGVKGLLDTLRYLRQHGILHAGAGIDDEQALSPAVIECHGIKFGMAAFCDHQPDFAADKKTPGMAYLNLDKEASAVAVLRKALDPLLQAAVDWPILSLHWGPNMELRPSMKFRRLAQAAINMGWKILFGHSAHVFQGIEIYRGCPIIYAAGDLVDDYYVDPEFKNDHQLLFEMELSRSALQRIDLHPVFIENCRVHIATGKQFNHIVTSMRTICQEMGTHVQQDEGKIWVAETNSVRT